MTFLQISILAGGAFFLAGFFWRKRSPAAWPVFPILSAALALACMLTLTAGPGEITWEQALGRGILVLGSLILLFLLRAKSSLQTVLVFALLFSSEAITGALAANHASDAGFLTNFARPLGYSYFLFRLADAVRVAPLSMKSFLLQVFAFPTISTGPVTLSGTFRVNPRSFSLMSAFYRRAVLFFFLGLTKIYLVLPFFAAHFETGILKPFQYDAAAFRSVFTSGLYHYASLYIEFSGAIDIAVGLSGMLGLRIPHNFRRPYFALSVSDFWRRWHITLGLWIRRHVYIPMGGSQRRPVWNLLAAMLLVGLWHGLSFKFALWGLLHGAALALERPLLARLSKTEQRADLFSAGNWKRPGPLVRYAVTQGFLILTWSVFFW